MRGTRIRAFRLRHEDVNGVKTHVAGNPWLRLARLA